MRAAPVALALLAAAGAVPGLVDSPEALIGALLLVGITSGATDVAINSAGVEAEAHSRGPVLNLAHASFSGCVVLASLGAAGLRAVGGGSSLVLGIACSVVAVFALLVALLGRRTRRAGTDDRHHTDGGRSADGRLRDHDRLHDHGTAPPRPERGLRRRGTPLLLFGGLAGLAYLVENAWQSWGAVHMQTTLHAVPSVSSLAPAVFAGTSAIGRLTANVMIRHHPPHRLLVTGALVAAAGTLTAALARTPWLGFAGIATAGVGTSVCAPTIISLAGAWAGPRHRGGAVSTVTTLAYLGFLVGPAAVGLVASVSSLSWALTAVAAVALLLALAALAAPTP